MAEDFDLIAEYRTDSGKGASRRLRRSKKVPAIVYGGGRPPRSVTFDLNQLSRKMENEAFFSSVLNVKVGDRSQAVILKDVQMHPAKPLVMHLDMQRIRADEKIKMSVPIHFLNEDLAVGVKLGGGSVSHMMTEVDIVCLPAALPEYFEIDIAELELDQTIYLSELKLPSGVEVPELAQEGYTDRGIVSIHMIKVVEEVEEPVEGEAAEGEEQPADEDSGDDSKAEGGDKGE